MQYGEKIRPYAYISHERFMVRMGFVKSNLATHEQFFAKPVSWEKMTELGVEYPPLISISIEDAQLLSNALWDAGIRPTQANGSAGQLQATERHLADIKEISGKLLDKVLKR